MLKKAINFMKNYKLSNFNFRLFIYVLAVTAVGIYAIGNAAEAEGYQLKQIIGLVLSLVVLTIFTLISYKFVFKFYWVIYGVMIFFLLLVMLFGETNLGAKRWIDLGYSISAIGTGKNISDYFYGNVYLQTSGNFKHL